jgi:Spy/CpxP family protein refolding chaperone
MRLCSRYHKEALELRVIAIVLVVICALVCVTGALAQGPATPPASPAFMRLEPRPCALMALRFIRPSMVPSLAKNLNLTDEQTAKITDLLAKADDALKPKIEEQRKATKDFATALTSPDASQAAIVSAFEKAMKSETAIAAESVKTLFALRGLLTDQQKADFNKMVETRTDPWRREGFGVSPGVPASPQPPPPPPPVEQPKADQPAK